jgi:glycerol kinase
VQWLRDELRIIRTASDIEALAASVQDNGGVTFIPAFTGLGAPHWNPHARAAILGMTRGTTAAHIARAALEAIALQTAEVLEVMRADSGLELKELRVDGAASRNNLLMQIQADVAGVRVVRAAVSETTALGAAYLAGLPTSSWKADRIFEPQADRAALREQWQDAIARCAPGI